MPLKRSQHPDRRNPTATASKVTVDVGAFVERLKVRFAIEKKPPAPTSGRPNANASGAIDAQINALKKRIAELESAPPKEIPILSAEQVASLSDAAAEFRRQGAALNAIASSITDAISRAQKPNTRPSQPETQKPSIAKSDTPLEPVPGSPEIAPSPKGGGVRRMMTALAQRPGLNQRQLGLRAGLSYRSGTFRNYVSQMRKNGWLDAGSSSSIYRLSPAGLEALGTYDPLPTGKALLNYWLTALGIGPQRILKTLAEVHPDALSKDELSHRSGMTNSGTFRNYLSMLRGYELIEGQNGSLKVSDELFQS